jgi:hypothetical protein
MRATVAVTKPVLKLGGRFVFNVWDRIEENVFANDVTNALAEMFPSDPPRFLARTPHGYHDKALIRDELENTGFSDVTIETRSEQSRAPAPKPPSDRLLPRDAAAQRDRSSGGRQITSRYGARGGVGCEATWEWRSDGENSGACRHGCGLGCYFPGNWDSLPLKYNPSIAPRDNVSASVASFNSAAKIANDDDLVCPPPIALRRSGQAW